jgi:hypothetical protein
VGEFEIESHYLHVVTEENRLYPYVRIINVPGLDSNKSPMGHESGVLLFGPTSIVIYRKSMG